MTSNTPGFTSLITADALAKAQAGELQLPPWEEFRQQLMGGSVKFPSPRHPFLFAGECGGGALIYCRRCSSSWMGGSVKFPSNSRFSTLLELRFGRFTLLAAEAIVQERASLLSKCLHPPLLQATWWIAQKRRCISYQRAKRLWACWYQARRRERRLPRELAAHTVL